MKNMDVNMNMNVNVNTQTHPCQGGTAMTPSYKSPNRGL